MDTARCLCPHDSQGVKCGRNTGCPFHGDHGKDPIRSWALSENDRRMLKGMRIATTDPAEIAQVRQADEDRFRP
jgi:hypothetical protein